MVRHGRFYRFSGLWNFSGGIYGVYIVSYFMPVIIKYTSMLTKMGIYGIDIGFGFEMEFM